MTPLTIAVMSHNADLAEWLIKKAPTAIQGKTHNNEYNILHLLAQEFYKYPDNLLPMLIKNNRQGLKELALERDVNGLVPYLSYFQ